MHVLPGIAPAYSYAFFLALPPSLPPSLPLSLPPSLPRSRFVSRSLAAALPMATTVEHGIDRIAGGAPQEAGGRARVVALPGGVGAPRRPVGGAGEDDHARAAQDWSRRVSACSIVVLYAVCSSA